MSITIPQRSRGRQTPENRVQYQNDLQAFAGEIIQIESTLDFKVSSRGRCYIFEEHGLKKGDFDQAQHLINDCLKSGLLPLDITSIDDNRVADGVQEVSTGTPGQVAEYLVGSIEDEAYRYVPAAFWENQNCYIEVMVEKIDLKSLFEPVCRKYHIPLTNVRGWSDIHSRAAMMKRFAEWEANGKQCILLYCGDHDPGGLNISESICSNLADLEDAVGWAPSDLDIDRFGLNHDFIEANKLSWVDNLETSSGGRLDDPRHRDHCKPYVQSYVRQFGVRKVEANALVTRSRAGRELCEQTILKYINVDAAEEYSDFIDEQQEEVRGLINSMMGGS